MSSTQGTTVKKGAIAKARSKAEAKLKHAQSYSVIQVPEDVKKKVEYQHIVAWVALPTSHKENYPNEQEPWECTNEREIAKKLGIDQSTISIWKSKQEFWEEVFKVQKIITAGDVADVILGLKRAAIATGKAPEVKLYLQLAGMISESEKVEHQISPELKKALDTLGGVLPD